MSNPEFTEVDAHKVISISLNKIANFRIQRGGPKLFKDLLVANVIQKAKVLVVDEIYSSSRSLSLDYNNSNFEETNLISENDVFEDANQGLIDPRPESSLQEDALLENKDDVTVVGNCSEVDSSKESRKEKCSSSWDENNKENEPLEDVSFPIRESKESSSFDAYSLSHKSTSLDSLETNRSSSPDLVLNPVNLVDVQQNIGNSLEDSCHNVLLRCLKRRSQSEDDVSENVKKLKKNEHLGSDLLGRKWRASSLHRPSHRTKHPLKRHRSRDFSIGSFDTDSDEDECFSDIKPFSKLKLEESVSQSALKESKPDELLESLTNNKTDEEQIANLSTVFSSSFDGLGLQNGIANNKPTFSFFVEKAEFDIKKSNCVNLLVDVCSQQAKNMFRRTTQSTSDHVAVTV